MAQRSCLGRVPGQPGQPLLDAIALWRSLQPVANDVERVLLALGAGNHVGRRNGRGRSRRRIGRSGIGIATLGSLVLVTGSSWRRLRHRRAGRQGHAGRRSQHQGQQQPATKGNEGIGLHARQCNGHSRPAGQCPHGTGRPVGRRSVAGRRALSGCNRADTPDLLPTLPGQSLTWPVPVMPGTSVP